MQYFPIASLLRFTYHPTFRPYYSPSQMLELGVGGGAVLHGSQLRKVLPKDGSWEQLLLANEATTYDKTKNHWGVEPIKVFTPLDNNPLPWSFMEWYIAFYYGRRNILDSTYVAKWLFSVGLLSKLTLDLFDDTNTEVLNHNHQDYLQTLLELGWNPKINFNNFQVHTLTNIAL